MFLVALDRTILATAIPRITDEFHSLTSVGWYGSAYLLTCCALQLIFGKIYTLFSVKWTLLWSILIFEASSALSGAAPNSTALIVGRAICGVGAAGIFAGVVVCIVHVVPLHKRPQVQGMFGALMGVSSIVGPLIGGGFTSSVTWRWCFYINLPVGAVAMLVILVFLKIPDQPTAQAPLSEKIKQLDIPGTILLVPGTVCLLLALQWGGQTYSWNNGRVIALLTLAGVLLVGFSAVQVLLPRTATLPPRILKQRSVVAACWTTLTINCGNYIIIYFLPIWFQSIKGASASESGIRTLPLMISMVAGSISGGTLNTKIGYYTPLAIVGTCLMCVGNGLLTTFKVDASAGKWIGYQILYGLGLGLSFQVPNLATQASLPKTDVPTGLALMLFVTLLGASVFVSAGENVLANQLVKRLAGVKGVDASMIISGGATSLLQSLPDDVRNTALVAYNEALRDVFRVGLIPTCLSVLGAVSLEWRSVKKPAGKISAENGEKEAKNVEKETTEKV
ncbi:MFS general substrate transporter [Aspergillus alliaceus]|uniref:MFS general substrate transporter n=1 Tax=Petromyces alliaceus TaxID=209559 RepID=A0A5N7C533_PETAA|nr:MFS general substrate transporter [Aspergillus alliaceus]